MQGWRTIAFNCFVAVIGVMAAANWVDVIPTNYVGPFVAFIGFINMYLRSKTTTPIGVKP